MTRRNFYRQLKLIGAFLVAWAILRFIVNYHSETFSSALDASTPPLLGVVALYVGSLFQRRIGFIDNLRKEWIEIVETKTDLIMFCKSRSRRPEQAIDAWGRLSVVIDRMRVVYKNVGENTDKIGYYPYEPLHDMRRVWEECVLAKLSTVSDQNDDYYQRIERSITERFQAIREVFLDELDLDSPTYPIIERDAQRRKSHGVAP